ncbi:MAG: acetate--CoA ligase [Fimbriimonadaceae bacterium]|nr:acetate--CoA ligase [Fimbriimonadaceae bacterium]
MSQQTLGAYLDEDRAFPPPTAFVASARVRKPQVYRDAMADPVSYWESWAKQLDWFEAWHTALRWNLPDAQWFVGGKLNACHNCVDRHVAAGLGEKTAFLAEGENGDVRSIPYRQVQDEVSKLANVLKSLGVTKGDRVCVYLPMVAELPFAMLACARIGAIHSVVFGGFSAEALRERIEDAGAKVLLTADGGWRRGGVTPLKAIADEALSIGCPTISKVLVLERVGAPGSTVQAANGTKLVPTYEAGAWREGRDVSWKEAVASASTDCPCEPMDSEDTLYILYTSGSTGKPKGIVHSIGGYLTQTYATYQWVFDHQPEDVFWCTADCGWVTGHSYVVYGPMANAATQVIYEGTPDTPDKDRFWRIIERHGVTVLYTAPTAIRTFMKWGEEYPRRCDLSSLRLLGSVGEPINPEAWVWYHEVIGGGRCPIVDTWWQTETGAIMISPLPGITTTKPGSATQPFPGISCAVMLEGGEDVTPIQGALGYMQCARGETAPARGEERGGILAIRQPWPGMLRGIWGDPARFRDVYWSKFPDAYFPGDGVKVDGDGYFWLLGRVDDVMLVSGHNISTMEVESALVDHQGVAEAAVIGRADAIKGQAIAAFVILKAGTPMADGLPAELKAHVAQKIGPIAKPDDIHFCADLPKTRSGKIMRRLLRDVAEGRALGDTTTLADPAVVASLKERYEHLEG